jgi:hypothetical protein
MEQTPQWLLPASERDQNADSSGFLSFSTSYARQPDEITHNFGTGVHAQSADSSLQSTTFQVPCLQDDEHLVQLGNSKSSITPEFEASHCQRILFVWHVVLNLCAANHDLALRTWVQLLEGEVGNDIWLWADGDEVHIWTSYYFQSEYSAPRIASLSGFQLTNSDLRTGISALERRIEHVRSGVTESLHMMKRRKCLKVIVHPNVRFAAIAWSIATSEAMRRADTSRGIQRRGNFAELYRGLRDIVRFTDPARAFIKSAMGADYWDKLVQAGHTCHNQIYPSEREDAGCWIYIASLVTLNHESDDTSFKILCGGKCTSGGPPAQSR